MLLCQITEEETSFLHCMEIADFVHKHFFGGNLFFHTISRCVTQCGNGNFSVTQILRENKFVECKRFKSARIPKCILQFRKSKCVKMADFETLDSPSSIFDFT